MGLFRSKNETYPKPAIAAGIERGSVARDLAVAFLRQPR